MYYIAKWVLDPEKIQTLDDVLLIVRQLADEHTISWDYPNLPVELLEKGLLKCVSKKTLEEDTGLLKHALEHLK